MTARRSAPPPSMPEPPAGFVRPLPPRHVLVGTDGSPTATEAARRAAVLAASARARLTVACVYSRGAPTAATSGPGVLGYLATSARDPYGIPWDARWRVTRAAEAEEIVRRAAELCRHCGCTTVETTVVAGEPASALVGLAAELPADLVVVGSKGLRSWARFVIGNVPDTVVRQAHCDVLVVRTD